jgi:hypothetical protein
VVRDKLGDLFGGPERHQKGLGVAIRIDPPPADRTLAGIPSVFTPLDRDSEIIAGVADEAVDAEVF